MNNNEITIENTNENTANANANSYGSGGGGVNIIFGSGGVLVGAGILLAVLFFLLGSELFQAVLFWLTTFVAATITLYLVARGYNWHKRNTQNEVLRWIQTGASIGLEVQRASIEAQSELHKALGGITVETIRTLRTNGALDKSYPAMFGPASTYHQLPDGKSASLDFPISIDDDKEWQ